MTNHFRVAIIGAGFGGLGMGIRLKQDGETSFVLLEKGNRAGGTWRDNTYPGAACDVQSHLYWFSFDETAGLDAHLPVAAGNPGQHRPHGGAAWPGAKYPPEHGAGERALGRCGADLAPGPGRRRHNHSRLHRDRVGPAQSPVHAGH